MIRQKLIFQFFFYYGEFKAKNQNWQLRLLRNGESSRSLWSRYQFTLLLR